jgi:rubredoxin
MSDTIKIMRCVVCGHEMSVEDWESLPEEVCCPECGVSKHDYELVEL